jgi:hypothetical protein
LTEFAIIRIIRGGKGRMDIPKFTGQCSISGRELKPGEVFFSVLTEKNNTFQRLDFAAENFDYENRREPEQCFAWWKTAVPHNVQKNGQKSGQPQPNVLMLELFEQLILKQDSPEEQPDMLYVLTLLLIRRRILRLEKEYEDNSGRKIIAVNNLKSNTVFEIPAAVPDSEILDRIQQQLAELLYTDE